MGTISKNEIKKIRSLAQKKFRDEFGLFTVEGEKLVAEALASSFQVERVYRREEIGEEAMSRITMLASPSPVLAVVRKPEDCHIAGGSLREAIGPTGLYLGLDVIRDPGNLGTIVRVADWFGADAVLAAEGTVDIFNPKVVQATMGAVFRVKFHYVNLAEAANAVLEKGGKVEGIGISSAGVYGTFMDGRNLYTEKLETGGDSPVMVVTGNEADGISPEMESLVSGRIAIPPYPADEPGSESLNAAVATAITVAEFRRRLI